MPVAPWGCEGTSCPLEEALRYLSISDENQHLIWRFESSLVRFVRLFTPNPCLGGLAH